MNPLSNNLLAEHLDNSLGDELEAVDPELVLAQALANPNLCQHITRTCQDGCDSISAYYRCQFEAGQQRYVLHIPFTPPLAGLPEVDANVLEYAEARVRITDRQKFGTRLEIVLPQPSTGPLSLMVETSITYQEFETKNAEI